MSKIPSSSVVVMANIIIGNFTISQKSWTECGQLLSTFKAVQNFTYELALWFYRLTWRNNALNNNKCNVLIYYNHQPLFHKKKNNKHIKGSPHLAQMINMQHSYSSILKHCCLLITNYHLRKIYLNHISVWIYYLLIEFILYENAKKIFGDMATLFHCMLKSKHVYEQLNTHTIIL